MDINNSVARRVKTTWVRPAGIAAYRGYARLRPGRPGPKVMINSLPKAGTHLVARLLDGVPGMIYAGRHLTLSELDVGGDSGARRVGDLDQMLGKVRASQYATGHLAYRADAADTLDRHQVRAVHVVRDPRALVVSTAHYLRNNSRHPLHETAVRDFPALPALFDALIDGFATDGGRRYVGVAERWAHFGPWLEREEDHVVRFESLVGTRGGGTREAQRAAVAGLLGYLGIDSAHGESVMAVGFDERSATFRQGSASGWRSELTDEQSERIHTLALPWLGGLSYPS